MARKEILRVSKKKQLYVTSREWNKRRGTFVIIDGKL